MRRSEIVKVHADMRRGTTSGLIMMMISFIVFGVGLVLAILHTKGEPTTLIIYRVAPIIFGLTIFLLSWRQVIINEKNEQNLRIILLGWPERIPKLVPPPGTAPVSVTEMGVQELWKEASKNPKRSMPTAQQLRKHHLSSDDPPPDAA